LADIRVAKQNIKPSMESEQQANCPQVRKGIASKANFSKTQKGSKIIRLPLSESEYSLIVNDRKLFRSWLV
jgi:hypothetical protein